MSDPTALDKVKLLDEIDNRMKALGSPAAYSYRVGVYHGYKYVKEKIESGDFDWVSAVCEQMKGMQEALEWYADKENYSTEHLSKHGYIPIDVDEGELARTALKALEVQQ